MFTVRIPWWPVLQLGPSVSKVSLTARSWVQVAETSLEDLQYSEQEVQYTLEAFPRYL